MDLSPQAWHFRTYGCQMTAARHMARKTLPEIEVQGLAARVSASHELRLPARLTQTQASQEERLEYASALLRHDPGVFLERHGRLLEPKEKALFEPLRDDYEIDFYLQLYEDEAAAPPEDTKKVSKLAKNRRLAKLQRLDREGFFEEEAVRKRAPLLHHQYLGKYGGPREPPGTGAANLHERLIQQQEELEVQSRMARQQHQEDIAGEAFEATLSESDDDSLGEREGSELSLEAPVSKTGAPEPPPISAEELEENRQDLQAFMRARFLEGEDGGAEADGDASLDDDWARERTQDAEDKYFDT